MADSKPETAPGWNRECVICGHKWMGLESDNCPACIARCERMWAAASGDMSDSKTASPAHLRCDVPGCQLEMVIRCGDEQRCYDHALERANETRAARGLPPITIDDEGYQHVTQ